MGAGPPKTVMDSFSFLQSIKNSVCPLTEKWAMDVSRQFKHREKKCKYPEKYAEVPDLTNN